jgi:starch phosphorylase
MVRDYVEELYEPTAAQTDRLSADGYRPAQELAAWKARVVSAWDGVEVLSVETDVDVASLGADRVVDAEVSLGTLDADDIEVQLLHGPVGQADELEQATVVTMGATGEGSSGNRRYRGQFVCEQAGRYGFTVRVVPAHPLLTSPVELGRIAWA